MIVLVGILFPILAGLLVPVLKLNKQARNVYVVIASLITSVFVFYLAFESKFTSFTLLNINKIFSIGFRIDGLSKVFLLIIATLWPIATLYATEYMEHEENQDSFFKYYLIAFGIAIGLTFSKNAITMYLFYELLTFLTLPLIMHDSYDRKAQYAGKVYLTVSVLGASIALIGIIILTSVVPNVEFIYSGVINEVVFRNNEFILNIAYILCFIGFGVKAAIIPFTYWLPTCGVAPTPVSALLHAVAVVKAGVFAIMRATHYLFGNANLYGGFAQKVVVTLAILTILYGSVMAVKEKQIKRRLAYSTASNLSYILFVVTLMTREGYVAGMAHMLFHAIIKINLFFIAGAIIIYSGKEYVDDMKGIAKKLPLPMFAFLVASLAMVGMPLTCGFISKYGLIMACVYADNYIALAGIIAIVISSLLTLIYLFNIIIVAYIPGADFDEKKLSKVKSEGLTMKIVFIIITIMIIYFGVNSTSLLEFIETVGKGMI
ncbi:MAG: proton-conducting membrane transporter [Lachnospiraceae bacterium]|nr:proton-conducting membrane transporter [Lachnospiraceae bacterium]